MKIIGIICEYNPFHLGHQKQIDSIRRHFEGDCAIVCIMSGNFVQRGMPAIFDKASRAEAALKAGADLVLELPVTCALSSAEGFAAGGVKILSGFCDYLCFGTETGTEESLMATAESLLRPEFVPALKAQLETGLSFPAARAAAMEAMGADASLLRSPNDILAVEYCKAILAQGSSMGILPLRREGGYHDTEADGQNPSATAVRRLIESDHDWKSCIPEPAYAALADAPIHTLAAGERAMLYRLRTMTDDAFEALPYGSEGLWRKLMHNSRSCSTLEGILEATKSKRYTRTRLDRMVMCAFLGITAADLAADAPYTRVLAFNAAGTAVLKAARQQGLFPHTGEKVDSPYQPLELRCDDLYGLFCTDTPASAPRRRVFIPK